MRVLLSIRLLALIAVTLLTTGCATYVAMQAVGAVIGVGTEIVRSSSSSSNTNVRSITAEPASHKPVTELEQLQAETQPSIRNPRIQAMSIALKRPECAVGQHTGCIRQVGDVIGPIKNGWFDGVAIGHSPSGLPISAGVYEDGKFLRSISLSFIDNIPRWNNGQLMTPDPTEATSMAKVPTEQDVKPIKDNRPRWNNGQLMTPDPTEATSIAKVPTLPAVNPVTELEQLKAEAEQAKSEKAELEAQLAAAQQQAQLKPTAPVGPRLSVHAIVIGNGAYQGSGRLDNPINDARAISAKLTGMGFNVTTVENADRNKLVSSHVKFSSSAADSDLTLFFYAGHGVQISGTNYMLPTDTNLNQIGGVPLHGISLNSVVEQFLPGKTKLVFLDACRDNPLLQVASRSVSRGLAPISVSQGTLISYATKDGSVAADGDGKNSPFTKALLQFIDDPDDIAVVLRRVRDQVMTDTDGQQQPWEYGSLSGGSLILSAIRAK